MTRDKEIEEVKNYENYPNGLSKECRDYIVKVLEQEPILDKIRAEIMQLDYDTESVDYDYNDMVQTEIIHTVCREEVLRVFDKYKAESEDKA